MAETKRERPKQVTVTLKAEELEHFQQLCAYENRSQAGYLRWLVMREIRSHELFKTANMS